ncbi:hypothetical protein BD779DRAFT_1542311 [Infundibulicybe gibba]|nr:hypothetical protein BD779DRAFT_1542311 [Infundibulicybe gibba]
MLTPRRAQISSLDVRIGADIVNRSCVASLAFLTWDILITFEREVQVIWPNPWSAMKLVYFFIRYVPLLVQISILFVGTELTPFFNFSFHDCYIWQVYQGVAAILIVIAMDFILILRVFALYQSSPLIRRLLLMLYVINIMCMATGLGLGIPGIEYNDICLVTYAPTIFLIDAGAPIVFQFILFILTAYKFIAAARAGWGRVPLLFLLMRDGTWAFFLLFAVLMGEVVVYGLPSLKGYTGMLYGWLLTTFSFSVRLSHPLNINHLSRPPGWDTTFAMSRRTDTNLQFTTNISGSDIDIDESEYAFQGRIWGTSSRETGRHRAFN